MCGSLRNLALVAEPVVLHAAVISVRLNHNYEHPNVNKVNILVNTIYSELTLPCI